MYNVFAWISGQDKAEDCLRLISGVYHQMRRPVNQLRQLNGGMRSTLVQEQLATAVRRGRATGMTDLPIRGPNRASTFHRRRQQQGLLLPENMAAQETSSRDHGLPANQRGRQVTVNVPRQPNPGYKYALPLVTDVPPYSKKAPRHPPVRLLVPIRQEEDLVTQKSPIVFKVPPDYRAEVRSENWNEIRIQLGLPNEY